MYLRKYYFWNECPLPKWPSIEIDLLWIWEIGQDNILPDLFLSLLKCKKIRSIISKFYILRRSACMILCYTKNNGLLWLLWHVTCDLTTSLEHFHLLLMSSKTSFFFLQCTYTFFMWLLWSWLLICDKFTIEAKQLLTIVHIYYKALKINAFPNKSKHTVIINS